MLSECDQIRVVAQAGCIADAEPLIATTQPDVLLLDIQLQGNENGLTLIPCVRRSSPHTAVVVLSAFLTPPLLSACREAGVSGYLVKDTKRLDLVPTVLAVAGGSRVMDVSVCDLERRVGTSAVGSLTPREFEVLDLVCKGLSNADIATKISVSENGVKSLVSAVMRKLGCKNRVQVVLKAKENHLC